MTKKGIIIISILTTLLILTGVLFGFVFCLRKQKVTIVGENIAYSPQAIINTAGLKNGEPIFLIDKEKAINKIESTFKDIKVIQIKTTSVTEIEIKVRNRYKTYYYENLGSYFILDEDLKVLEKIEIKKDNASVVENLVYIDEDLTEVALEKINVKTNVADFIGSNTQQKICYNLFTTVYETQMETETGLDARVKMSSLISSISFDTGYTQSGKSHNKLIVKTKEGITFEIGKADKDLYRKVYACFEAMKSDKVEDKSKGSIIVDFDANDKEFIYYSKGE